MIHVLYYHKPDTSIQLRVITFLKHRTRGKEGEEEGKKARERKEEEGRERGKERERERGERERK